jgi:predicted nucleic acid-binding protein
VTYASAIATFYFDASALVKRYMAETGTAWVESVCANDSYVIATAQIGLVEVAAAFASKRRGTFITPDEYDNALIVDSIEDVQWATNAVLPTRRRP